ncbi:MAG: hypothetical protein OES38_14290, partial [Gammaproteobacteria bacterium]|nr:hypothetical protein [Gammaproteobacteria bacterium]
NRQKHKEDLIIEKKIRDLRAQKAIPIGRHGKEMTFEAGTDADDEPKRRGGVMGWFKKSS